MPRNCISISAINKPLPRCRKEFLAAAQFEMKYKIHFLVAIVCRFCDRQL